MLGGLDWDLFSVGWKVWCNKQEAKPIHQLLQNVVYSIFGTNFRIGSQMKDHIQMLKVSLPSEFRERAMDDLGCGDGKITLLLKEILQPKELRGFDVNAALVRRARSKGIDARVQDLCSDVPTGELAVLWGVLHHLEDRETCIRKICENYAMAVIREPIKSKDLKGLEMGDPLVKEEIEALVRKYLPTSSVFYHNHSIFIYYRKT